MTDGSPGPDALYVVVSGGPGSGKTTLARRLAPALGLPLLAKDTIKEAMLEDLDVPDVEASRVLGRASVSAMLAVARDCGHGVVESAWHRSRAADRIGSLSGHVVEVFCRCDPQVMAQRYWSRVSSRHPGHFDGDRVTEELWNPDTTEPVAGGWPVVEVDTSGDVDVADVVDRVLEAFETSFALSAAQRPREEWIVWRQDEHGNRAEVTRRESQEVAQKVADAMEATGHKQTYWVSRAESAVEAPTH